jgi:hypothetical protein
MPQPGEFWLADIPFTNGAASKVRPVLVLWMALARLADGKSRELNPARH